MQDNRSINSLHFSEVAQAIVEAKLKMTDVPAVITLSSELHQIYGEFSQHLFENWQKVLTIKHGEKVQNASKLRVDVRLYCELLSVGIFSNKVSRCQFPLSPRLEISSDLDWFAAAGLDVNKLDCARQGRAQQFIHHSLVL